MKKCTGNVVHSCWDPGNHMMIPIQFVVNSSGTISFIHRCSNIWRSTSKMTFVLANQSKSANTVKRNVCSNKKYNIPSRYHIDTLKIELNFMMAKIFDRLNNHFRVPPFAFWILCRGVLTLLCGFWPITIRVTKILGHDLRK